MGRTLQGEIRKCQECHKNIRVAPSAIKRGKGKFCSKSCANMGKIITCVCKICNNKFTEYLSRLSANRGKFCSRSCYKKDWIKRVPGWNKGKTATWSVNNKHRLGKSNPNPHIMRGENNLKWKGDKVGYRALHKWVERVLGKPMKCTFCGIETKKKYHWANISKKYLRNMNDWIRLCPKCHKCYDTGKIQI